MDLSIVRTALAADLAATGLLVATDPAGAHAPCVLVGPVTEVSVAGPCAWDCTVPVWLIAPAPGDDKAVTWLAEHVTAVLDATGSDAASLGSYNVGQGDLPAYQITATVVAKEA